MMCYRDMTFCPFYVLCKYGKECPRALTPEVIRGAQDWMGKDAPICEYVDLPDCYEMNAYNLEDWITENL